MIFMINKMTLEEAFEFLIRGKMLASELKKALRLINRLKKSDWRYWFGRFLIAVRSDADTSRFVEAYLCLQEAERMAMFGRNLEAKESLYSMLNSESLFWEFCFHYEKMGICAAALYVARAYENGWGVKVDLKEALKAAKIAITMNKNEPLYSSAQDVFNLILTKTT